MQIKQIQNKQEWNQFILKNNGSFLQSWEWGAFQYEYGRSVEYAGVVDNNEIIAGALLIRYNLPADRFYYFSPYGPVIHHQLLEDYLREQADRRKIIFWRYENQGPQNGLSVKSIHPAASLILNLDNKSETELLAAMKSKTRYNIHLAEKKGVNIRVSDNIRDLDVFYGLIKATAKRQKITIHPESYYQIMFHALGDANMLKLYLAEYKGKILAANLMVYFNGTATYLHGGTSDDNREVMAPHLLQWQAICDAKKAGLRSYDFFGIAETDDEAHPWAGITRFKKGFSGQVRKYYGTHELPLNKIWYSAYKLVKKIKS